MSKLKCQMSNPERKCQSFTLIELLVVIAIIGILASTAMLRYPFTVRKVKDSRIVTSLTQFRVQAYALKTVDGNYKAVDDCAGPPLCDCSDKSLGLLCEDVQALGTQDIIINVNDDLSGYCAVAFLPDYNQYFCVDHKLTAKKFNNSPAAPGGKCNNCSAGSTCACE